MKAESNFAPAPYSVDIHGDEAEIRLREKPIQLPAREDDPSERWSYDEYVITVRNRAGLEAEIKKNQVLWLSAAKGGEYKALAQAVRGKRDALLSDCDWTQAADTPVSGAAALSWQAYRQALRDIPQQGGFPWAVDWPVSVE